MACRVGMTTDPEKRKQDWESKHSNLRNWEILGFYESKTDAQKAEKMFAEEYGCVSSHGGRGPEHANWAVYRFQYGMDYEPPIFKANEVKRIPLLTGRHTAILLNNISAGGSILYRFILCVIENDTQEPCFYVASELSTANATRMQYILAMSGKWDEAEKEGSISYCLGIFPGSGHENHGFSEEWGDQEEFERAAMKIVEESFYIL